MFLIFLRHYSNYKFPPDSYSPFLGYNQYTFKMIIIDVCIGVCDPSPDRNQLTFSSIHIVIVKYDNIRVTKMTSDHM